MTKPEVVATHKLSQRNVRRALAEARSLRPSEVVIWYACPDKGTGVIVSTGTNRVKAVGGLVAAAIETWGD